MFPSGFPDDDQEDALLLAEANNDEDVRLHGCKTVEELAYRLDQLSEELLLLETDPILQIVAFTGEVRPAYASKHFFAVVPLISNAVSYHFSLYADATSVLPPSSAETRS